MQEPKLYCQFVSRPVQIPYLLWKSWFLQYFLHARIHIRFVTFHWFRTINVCNRTHIHMNQNYVQIDHNIPRKTKKCPIRKRADWYHMENSRRYSNSTFYAGIYWGSNLNGSMIHTRDHENLKNEISIFMFWFNVDEWIKNNYFCICSLHNWNRRESFVTLFEYMNIEFYT